MSKSTPGPWKIEETPESSYHDFVVKVGRCRVSIDTDNELCDARLIAAAPDLLAALQSLVDMCRALDTGNRDMPPEAAYRAALQSASAAISKATKEQ